jgi:spore maturation protein CgeB
MRIVFLGLSITSSWGNGHATNYRALVRALDGSGHDVLFLERERPWYASARDLPEPPWGRTEIYRDLAELRGRFTVELADADLVVIGSYVPDGVEVAGWALDVAGGATAFYDIDTPITTAKLEAGDAEYLSPALVPRFDLYLSFTGGPFLERLAERFRARSAHAFYCLVDPERYRPEAVEPRWDLGYLGTYSADRQATLERLLLEPARRRDGLRFAVAGPQYPRDMGWPANVERFEHLPPGEHPRFYCAQRFTLNVTRERMREAGWSPSVRLFEAAACAVPAISDWWPGLDELFAPGEEVLVARDAADVIELLESVADDERRRIGEAARRRVLAEHTAERRAEQLERLVAVVGAGVAA